MKGNVIYNKLLVIQFFVESKLKIHVVSTVQVKNRFGKRFIGRIVQIFNYYLFNNLRICFFMDAVIYIKGISKEDIKKMGLRDDGVIVI